MPLPPPAPAAPLLLEGSLQGLELGPVPLLQARQAAALQLQQPVHVEQVAAQGSAVLLLRLLQVCGQALQGRECQRPRGGPGAAAAPPAPRSPR